MEQANFVTIKYPNSHNSCYYQAFMSFPLSLRYFGCFENSLILFFIYELYLDAIIYDVEWVDKQIWMFNHSSDLYNDDVWLLCEYIYVPLDRLQEQIIFCNIHI